MIRPRLISLIILMYSIASFSCYSQNLVPNPSFETYTSCPTFHSQLNLAASWSNPIFHSGTPDLFHTCSVSNMSGVPTNHGGQQMPASGNGYAGIFTYEFLYREYINAPLLQPLVAGKYYEVSLKWSTADSGAYSSDNLGIHVSDTQLVNSGLIWGPMTHVSAQIESPPGITLEDSTGWNTLCGCIEATGGEQWITIGNFNDDATTTLNTSWNTTNTSPFLTGAAFYYIDDISLARPQSYFDTICAGEQAMIYAKCGSSWNWFEAGNPTVSLGTNDTLYVSPDSTKNYVVTINGTSNDTGEVFVYQIVIDTLPTILACDSIDINGTWYFSSQSIFDTILRGSVNNCDSITFTEIVIKNSVATYDTIFLCNSEFPIVVHGTDTANFPGLYFRTFPSSNGCDSNSFVWIISKPSGIFNNVNQLYCDSAFIFGNWYDSSQTIYTPFPGAAANGCDSLVITELTITNDTLITLPTITSCDSVEVNGTWYYASQTIGDTLFGVASGGCDSIINTPVIINYTIFDTANVIICPGDSALIHGNYESTPGTYTQTYTAQSSCDSIVSVVLNIHSVFNGTGYDELCQGDSSLVFGDWKKQSGSWLDSTLDVNGCWSTNHITLVFFPSYLDTLYQTICSGDSTWFSDQYQSQAGIYTDTNSTVPRGINLLSCDSITVLNLSVQDNVFSNMPNISACDSLQVGSTWYYSSQTISDTLFGGASSGCDSIINTPIIIHTSPSASINLSNDVTCFGATNGSASVVGSNPLSTYYYLWDASTGSQTTQTAVSLAPGNYDVTITDSASGCTASTYANIGEPIPVSVSSSSVSICNGQTASLTASASGGTGSSYTYNWDSGSFVGNPYNVTPITTTTFSVFAADGNGCNSVPINVQVIVSSPLLVDAGNEVAICQGESVTLMASASGGNGPQYFFTWDNGLPYGPSHTVTPLSTTTYTVTVDDSCSLPDQDQVTVVVNPLPIVNFTVNNFQACELPITPFTFFSPASSTDSIFTWNFGDGLTITDIASTIDTFTHSYSIPGIYDVTLFVSSNLSTGGCSNALTKNNLIEIFQNPVADFVASPNPTSMFDPVVHFSDFSISYAQPQSLVYLWRLDEEIFSNSPNHSYTFPNDTGNYLVDLLITDINGCSDTAQELITILGEYGVYVPNTFTPNADGINDNFAPKGFGILENDYSFLLFNRWGELIFESYHLDEGWDGRFKNKMAPSGTYVWKLEFLNIFGDKHSKIGKVHLVK